MINGTLCEVAGNEEISIGHQEVRERLLDVAFDWLLEIALDFAEVTFLVEHLCEELFESTVFAHLIYVLLEKEIMLPLYLTFKHPNESLKI